MCTCVCYVYYTGVVCMIYMSSLVHAYIFIFVFRCLCALQVQQYWQNLYGQ